MNIQIKKMTLLDLENIQNILTSEFDDFWTYTILKDELNSENSQYIVALLNNEIVGFAGIKVILDEADIMNIVTKKSFRKKGIGSSLLKEIINICTNMSLAYITLEVNEENLSAINLYQKFGFEEAGIRKNYYQDKNGIFMKKYLLKQ